MKRRFLKVIGTTTLVACVIVTGLIVSSKRGHADEGGDGEGSKIRIGFAIAPVPLNLRGKNRDLVGLGSYIVNAQANCNGCHSSDPATKFVPGGNPYFGQHPTKVNPATYLGGGQDFGAFPVDGFANIITRNLTPGKTGLPEGDHTLQQFLQIMRTGVGPELSRLRWKWRERSAVKITERTRE